MTDYRSFLLRVRDVIAQTTDVLEQIHDDDVLSSTIIGGEMEPNMLQAARAKVDQLQKAAREALDKKQKLEQQAKTIRDERESGSRKFTIRKPPMKVGNLFTFYKPAPPKPEQMTDDTLAWLRQNAPDKLPKVAPPELTIEQQAKFAHNDYCDLCYRLQAAKCELQKLEKKVSDMRELLRAVEAA